MKPTFYQRALLFPIVATILSGCGAQLESAHQQIDRLQSQISELESARSRDSEQIDTLNKRLIVLESRLKTSGRPELPVVRITPEQRRPSKESRPERYTSNEEDYEIQDEQIEEDQAEGKRPVLKLWGSYAPMPVASGSPLQSAPRKRSRSVDLNAVGERLPVVPMPDLPGTPPLETTPATFAVQNTQAQQQQQQQQQPGGIAFEQVMTRARQQVQAGQCGAAITELGRMLGQSPEHRLAPEAMLLRARCHRRQGSPLRAIGEVERMTRRYPRNAYMSQALLVMAESYASLGDLQRAREIFGRIMRNYPRSSAARRATVRVQELGRSNRAREEQ